MKRLWISCLCSLLLAACAGSNGLQRDSSSALTELNAERLVVVTLRNQAVPAIPRAGSTVRVYEGRSSYALAPATRGNAKALASAHGLREVAAWPIGLLGVHCVVFELRSGVGRDDALERLRRDPRVESAQPYQSFRTLGSTSNDPYRSLQRNLDVMNVSGAHAWSRGEGVRIGIVDTGIDIAHPDLAGRVVRQDDFVDGETGRNIRDLHGTAVAGVIAAAENNGQGIIGIAPAARLYGLRACWPAPDDDTRALCSTLTLAKALARAIESRMDIVNLSLAGPADPLLRRLVEVGLRRGVVFVGAAPSPANQSSFPTGIGGVISVDGSGARASADSVLFAPANEVLTLVPHGKYDFLSGSSLAAASVSGGIALLMARDRDLRADSARELLARSSRAVTTDRGETSSVNLCAALAALMRQAGCNE